MLWKAELSLLSLDLASDTWVCRPKRVNLENWERLRLQKKNHKARVHNTGLPENVATLG